MIDVISFNEPIGHWNTSNVTDMGLMFYGRNNGEDVIGIPDGIFNQDISGWDVSNVGAMWNMFQYQSSFNQDLSGWCVTNNPTEPSRFDLGCIAWEDKNKPVWGTCPPRVPDEPDLLLINRSGRDYALPATKIEALTDDADLLVVNRDGVDYQVSGKDVKDYLLPSLPWVGHDGGIWHVRNATITVNLTNGPYAAYKVDGTSIGGITQFGPGDDIVFLTTNDASLLFQMNFSANWEFGEITDTSKVTDMSGMFIYDLNMTQDISGWDTSNVTNMSRMFYHKVGYLQDINRWDVSNVKDMSSTFENCVYLGELNNWDVSNVTNMESMWNLSSSNPDIRGWDVSNVTNMDRMFKQAYDFNRDLSNWCVTNITSQPNEFDLSVDRWTEPRPCWGHCPPKGDPCPPTAPPWEGHDGGIWHIKNVEHAPLLLDKHSAPYTAWDIDGTNEREIDRVAVGEELVFVSAPGVHQLFGDVTPGMEYNSITDWEFGKYTDTSKATDFTRQFAGCHKFTGPLGGNWDTSNVTQMRLMFFNATSFNEPIGHWDTSNVTDMGDMFWAQRNALDTGGGAYGPGIFNQDISGWDVSNVTDMENMFLRQTSFNQDLSNWCVTNITSKPTGFDQGASAWTEPRPKWGTCPRGEDQNP